MSISAKVAKVTLLSLAFSLALVALFPTAWRFLPVIDHLMTNANRVVLCYDRNIVAQYGNTLELRLFGASSSEVFSDMFCRVMNGKCRRGSASPCFCGMPCYQVFESNGIPVCITEIFMGESCSAEACRAHSNNVQKIVFSLIEKTANGYHVVLGSDVPHEYFSDCEFVRKCHELYDARVVSDDERIGDLIIE